jgi:ATP-binding cassette subfamily F protein 3
MLNVRNLCKSFGARQVLAGVSFSVRDGQRAALIGQNGVGKSTLLRLVAGLEQPDSGEIIITGGQRVAYLPQEIKHDELSCTGLEYLKRRAGLGDVEQRLAHLEQNLDNQAVLDEYTETQNDYDRLGGYGFDVAATKVMSGLGLRDRLSSPVGQLSGGQQSKLMLASVLLTAADLVLLDEPTNNLDLEAIGWLEDFILSSRQSFLIVSHDRMLLERVVEKVVEIDWFERTATEFTGVYADYLEHCRRQVNRREQQYEDQQDQRQQLEQSVKQSRQWAEVGRHQERSDNEKLRRGQLRDRSSRLAGRAVATERRLERLPVIERVRQREPLIIPLVVESVGRGVLTAKDVVAGYARGFATQPFSLNLLAGERIGLIGANGAGKSTILRTIIGEQPPLTGLVTVNRQVVMGVLAQAHENMPRQQTAFEHYQREVREDTTDAYTQLARFHLLPTDVEKLVDELSPGERARLQLATFAARGVNLLVLDEPTNHLDTDALDALVAVLKTYRGAVLFVSHDRYFLENMTGADLYEIQGGHLRRQT